MFQNILRRVGLWFPSAVRLWVERMLTYAGISESSEIWLGKFMSNSVALGLAGVLLVRLVPSIVPDGVSVNLARFVVFFLAFTFGSGLTLLLLYYEVKRRIKEIEKFLPDYLELIASNLSAGIAPFDSFRAAARPEFGPLYNEVLYVSAKTQGTGALGSVFHDLSERIPSKMLQDVIRVFEKGVRSGSKLSKLLKAIAEEIRTSREMEELLLSSVKSNVIFLCFLLILVAPFLLAISGQFVRTYNALGLGQNASDGPNMLGLQIGGNPYVKTLDLQGIFVLLLVVVSVLTSALIGVMMDNDPVMGLKYIIPLAVFSVASYLFAAGAMGAMLSGFGG